MRSDRIHAHQLAAFVGRYLTPRPSSRHTPAGGSSRPVERRAVVVHRLRVRDDLANLADHAANLHDMRFSSFDPQQVSVVLQRGDAIEHATRFARVCNTT